ncbi:MAG: hypothetical protein WAV46_00705 [Candidatus Moraniibacteriota bacterium]
MNKYRIGDIGSISAESLMTEIILSWTNEKMPPYNVHTVGI